MRLWKQWVKFNAKDDKSFNFERPCFMYNNTLKDADNLIRKFVLKSLLDQSDNNNSQYIGCRSLSHFIKLSAFALFVDLETASFSWSIDLLV